MARTAKKQPTKVQSLPDPKELIREAKAKKRAKAAESKALSTTLQEEPAEARPKRQYGNRRNLSHGLYGGMLPPGCDYIKIRLDKLRRNLEDQVLIVKGVDVPSLSDASTINTVCRCERTAMLALHWLRTEGDKLDPMKKLSFLERIHKASMDRDKAIKALQLDRDSKQDIFDALYKVHDDE